MEVLVKDNEVVIPKEPLLRHHQREEMKEEIAHIDNSLHPSNQFRIKNTSDSAAAASRGRGLKKQLDQYSPPSDLPGSVKDKIAKRAKQLEEKILVGMPTQEEMRKNPAGMVDRHIKWEKENKAHILEWKNAQILLQPDSSDQDLANFERLRPAGEMDQFRAGAQITGHMGYYNVPQELWDMVFKGKGPDSALAQVQRVEAEHTEAKVDKRTLPRTEEQKRELVARLASARANQAKAKDPVSPQEGESVPFEGA